MRSAFLVYIHLSSVRQCHPAIHGYQLKSENKTTTIRPIAHAECALRFKGGGELVEQNAVHDKIKKGVMHLHDPF